MADFCNQCAKELGFPEGDFKKDLSQYNYDEHIMSLLSSGIMGFIALCESCDCTLVDYEGNCISHNCPIHGETSKTQWWKDCWAGR